jgi:hypothetical protein
VKREGFRHSKVYRLAKALTIPHYAAVGLLDCLWDLTAREAPRGDIGKLQNDDIAHQVGWPDSPDDLIRALIDCKLADVDEDHRIIIHDWSEHAEDGVHSRLARSGMLFADGKPPKTSKLSTQDRPAAEAKIAEAIRLQKAAERRRRAPEAAAGSKAVAVPLPCLALPSHADLASEPAEPPRVRVVDAAGATADTAIAADLKAARTECQTELDLYVAASGRNADQLLAFHSRPKRGTATIVNIWLCHNAAWLRATASSIRGARLADAGEAVESAAAKARASPPGKPTAAAVTVGAVQQIMREEAEKREHQSRRLLGGPGGDSPEAEPASNG